jgi:hypothetical protein
LVTTSQGLLYGDDLRKWLEFNQIIEATRVYIYIEGITETTFSHSEGRKAWIFVKISRWGVFNISVLSLKYYEYEKIKARHQGTR